MTGPLRTFEGPEGRLWRMFLRTRTEGLSGSANLGAEDLVFVADLFTQAQPRRAGQEMSFPWTGERRKADGLARTLGYPSAFSL